MEGPYRDLGAGFARLTGVEGLRRGPGRIEHVEDALLELLRNARDADARNIYVASSLKARRYRTLVVIDDGQGIPETHKHLVFEPGVTTRHLIPVPDTNDALLHGAGLSLYHIKNAALSAEILSTSSPTAIRAVFDTHTLPEKSLQSTTRPSKTNLLATLASFARQTAPPRKPCLYHASPARILALLLNKRIIQRGEEGGATRRVWREARVLGLEVSSRTVQRVLAGEVVAAEEVVAAGMERARGGGGRFSGSPELAGGPILSVDDEDLAEIRGVLRRAARSRYLDIEGHIEVERRPGEVILRARVYEPEDEYE